MKRTGKVKSKRTKPRPLDNETLYGDYGDFHPHSEFARWLGFTFMLINGKFVRDEVNPHRRLEAGEYWYSTKIVLQTHHLWSVRQRPDFWSNLLVVTDPEHRWCERYKPEGRLLCALAKLRKRFGIDKRAEFTAAEIHQAGGIWIGGYLETTPFDLDLLPDLRRLRAEAIGLARLAEIEDGRSSAA